MKRDIVFHELLNEKLDGLKEQFRSEGWDPANDPERLNMFYDGALWGRFQHIERLKQISKPADTTKLREFRKERTKDLLMEYHSWLEGMSDLTEVWIDQFIAEKYG